MTATKKKRKRSYVLAANREMRIGGQRPTACDATDSVSAADCGSRDGSGNEASCGAQQRGERRTVGDHQWGHSRVDGGDRLSRVQSEISYFAGFPLADPCCPCPSSAVLCPVVPRCATGLLLCLSGSDKVVGQDWCLPCSAVA